jgi:hypothetical protein
VIPVADRLVDNIAISTCGTDMQKRASSIFHCIYVWVRGDFNGLNISKVKVQGHGEIDLRYFDYSGRDRNLEISILIEFMGIPAGYSFSR